MQEFKEATGTLSWMKLLKEAENFSGLQETGETVKEIEIEVKEVLAVGLYYACQDPIAIVKDKEQRIWQLPESGNLVSRHDVKEGMKIKLKITTKTQAQHETEVLVLE